MNWEAVSAIAELLGAIAVFASLIYLAIQVRHSAGVSRASAFQAMIDGVTAHRNYMFGPENVKLVMTALKSYEDQSIEDRARFDNLATNLMNYFEASYHAAGAQTMREETLANWAWMFETRLFCYPGGVAWWEKARPLYPPEIRDWVDRRVQLADPMSDYFGLLSGSSGASLEPGQLDEPTDSLEHSENG